VWYFQIIERSKTRNLERRGTEGHHIIPKCFGGSNDSDNIARLTYREHFICHQLLTRMTEGIQRRKMWYALWTMGWSMRDRIVSPRQYSIAKKARYEGQKLLLADPDYLAGLRARSAGVNNPRYGKSLSPELRSRISAACKMTHNLPDVLERCSISKKLAWANPELRARASLAAKNRPPVSAETRAKLSESGKRRPPQSIEDRAKKSEAAKRRPPISEETRAKLRLPKSYKSR